MITANAAQLAAPERSGQGKTVEDRDVDMDMDLGQSLWMYFPGQKEPANNPRSCGANSITFAGPQNVSDASLLPTLVEDARTKFIGHSGEPITIEELKKLIQICVLDSEPPTLKRCRNGKGETVQVSAENDAVDEVEEIPVLELDSLRCVSLEQGKAEGFRIPPLPVNVASKPIGRTCNLSDVLDDYDGDTRDASRP